MHLIVGHGRNYHRVFLRLYVVISVLIADIFLSVKFNHGNEMQFRGKSLRSWYDGSSDRSFMVDPLSYFSRSNQSSTTGVTKAVVCVILSVG